jgi:EAL domain-containing protein (putative c-di-GMP-specific phosphodiesterase class I)
MDIDIVAEGIETDAELRTLVDLGVPYGQGYHLAEPGPLRP